MRYLICILLLCGNFSFKSQENKYTSNIKKTIVVSNRILYDAYISKYSNRLFIQKKDFQIPKITLDEQQLGYIHGSNKNLKINKDELIKILKKYAKHGIKREAAKDYTIGFNFYINKVTHKIEHIFFMIPDTYLKDLKLINQLENELIKKISFSFINPPYIKGLSSPYLNINYVLTNKDLEGKF